MAVSEVIQQENKLQVREKLQIGSLHSIMGI